MAQRVLLCDDEVHIIRAAEFKLSRAGYDVECAFDGEAGWQAIVANKPDLLVVDMQMPRLTGLGLIERIRANDDTKSIPIFMLTGKGLELSRDDVLGRLGVLDIIGKPFSPRDLLIKVNGALKGTPAPVLSAELSLGACQTVSV
jgi:two-component system alkaline phosphatase synthesis response regulator PhoP